ncbi:heat shock 70 kDa protein 12B isoform X2 [Malaclemys terrapin pileata]|uniref:heat shock 70 kDa protein 12B isoform X2 n=1 Tax=Malaclemys terrapin pileata TaxID=2991368 RepID=UPI0023A8DBAE|nr:heat shock 70 kDa protein 12B isoform X2 [Malaclemys terrapin pileata]
MSTFLDPGMHTLQIGTNGESSQTPSPPSSPGMHNESCSIAPLTPSQSPRNDARAQRPTSFSVVVAIDFGTTSSGYAFSFSNDPEAIHMMRKWEGGDPGVANQKTPTSLLLTPEGAFHSFGYTARDYYHDLDPEEARDWLYFEKFKMKIHSTSAGLVSPANPEQLLIALEPEAASIYCRKLRLNQLIDLSCKPLANGLAPELSIDSSFRQAREQLRRSRHSRTFLVESGVGELWSEMQAGDRYIVADCGGGTVDLTVHQIEQPQGTLKELYKASGGPYGAVGVDLAFETLLGQIFGEDFIATFKAKRPAAWVDLTIAFEARKRAAAPFRSNPLNVSLPFSFIDFYRRHRGQNVETALKRSSVNFVKWSSQGMLRMSSEAMNDLFQPTVSQIIRHIDDLLKKPDVKGIKFLFLVGGFAESAMLQHAVQSAFGSLCRVIIPQDVGLTILKGAVLFGLDPTIVRVRRSPLTYGVGVLNKFVEGKHPKEKLLVKEGKNWCTDIFEKFVSVDQSVALGEVVQRSYCPARVGQRKIIINIYCCATDDVVYITDPGVRKCGTISLELDELDEPSGPKSRRREIRASMQFGDTELKVAAMDVRTSKTVRAAIDFLSN